MLPISWRSAGMVAAFVVLSTLGVYPTIDPYVPGRATRPTANDLVRQANDAFARQEYEDALKLYEQAEAETLDPGLISNNKAAAYYRLGMYKPAIDGYRRCLADDEAPASRRARAHFDLGNALVQYGPDNAQQLAEAVQSYHACLLTPELPSKVRTDARHNLELAQLLWLKAWQKLPDAQKHRDDPKRIYPEEKKPDEDYKQVDLTKDAKKKESDNLPREPNTIKNVRSDGTPQVLPDDDNVLSLPADDALATLQKHAERIAEARRRLRNPEGPATLTTKDW